MALLLAAAKNVVRHTEAIRAGRFLQDLMGKSVRGKTLGIVGLGGIGGEAARLAMGLGMRVVGINRHGTSDAPVAWCGTIADLDRLLTESDFVLLSIPLTRHTLGIIGARELGLMKPDAVLINIARGNLIRERDLYEHLKAHPEFVAALDVWWTYPKGDGRPFTQPFHELPNVVMTPHVAWAVPEQSARSLEAALENVARFLRGEPPRNVVDRAEYAFEAA
jgi:phosphoglycerate dehydrogenase-like enzyme